MGGTVSIAARFNDGQAICVDGWTNFVPNMVMNQTTLSGDDSLVKRDLLEVAELDSYEGPIPFRATGYGMIVIDFIGKAIHSMQGYTSFDIKTLSQILDTDGRDKKTGYMRRILTDNGKALIDAGRVSVIDYMNQSVPNEKLTAEAALKLIAADDRAMRKGTARPLGWLKIDTAPFTVFEYEEHTPLTLMKQRLREAGFPLTKAEGLNAMFSLDKGKSK